MEHGWPVVPWSRPDPPPPLGTGPHPMIANGVTMAIMVTTDHHGHQEHHGHRQPRATPLGEHPVAALTSCVSRLSC